jgi:hypothetical protein
MHTQSIHASCIAVIMQFLEMHIYLPHIDSNHSLRVQALVIHFSTVTQTGINTAISYIQIVWTSPSFYEIFAFCED